MLHEALKKLEIRIDQPRADGMHLLRHTSGSLIYRRTANVKIAQEWLGHAPVSLSTRTRTSCAMNRRRRRTLCSHAGRRLPQSRSTDRGFFCFRVIQFLWIALFLCFVRALV